MPAMRKVRIYDRNDGTEEVAASVGQAARITDSSACTISRNLKTAGWYVTINYILCFEDGVRKSWDEILELADSPGRHVMIPVKVTDRVTKKIRRYASFAEAVRSTRQSGGRVGRGCKSLVRNGFIVSSTHVIQLNNDNRPIKEIIALDKRMHPQGNESGDVFYVLTKDNARHETTSVSDACALVLPKVSIPAEIRNIRRTLRNEGYHHDPYYNFTITTDPARLPSQN